MRKESFAVIAITALASLLPAAPAAASGKAAAVEKHCVQLSHAGSQDKPVGSVRMCPGKKPKRAFQSSLENKWGFDFDPAAYERLRAVVVREKGQPATPAGILPHGTFSVSWREEGKPADEEYTLQPEASCRTLDELAQAVPAQQYAEFIRVLADLKARVQCPAETSR